MKNKIFHTQDLCLRTNLRCAKDSARMEINLKKYIAAIGICFMALGAACIMKKDPEEVGEELPELIIGSDNYEPYNYLDDDGKPVGIDVELAEAVCEQLGYTPVFQYIVWDKKDEYLDNGKVDCLQIPLHRITDSASNGSVFPVVTEHFSASSDHAFL